MAYKKSFNVLAGVHTIPTKDLTNYMYHTIATASGTITRLSALMSQGLEVEIDTDIEGVAMYQLVGVSQFVVDCTEDTSITYVGKDL